MTARRAYLIAALVLLAAAVLSWRQQQRDLRRARAELEASIQKKSGLQAEIQRLRSSAAEVDREKEQLAAAMAAARKALGSDQSAPEVRARQRKNIMAWLALRNNALYRKLGLTADQIAQWEELAGAHWIRMEEIEEKTRSHELSGAMADQMRHQENSQFKQGETDLLGAAADQQIQDYERSLPARAVANGVAGNLYYTNTPLTAEEGDQLTQILASNSAAYQKGDVARADDVDAAAVLAQAAQILSPRQLDSLRDALQSTEGFAKLWGFLFSPANPVAKPAGSG